MKNILYITSLGFLVGIIGTSLGGLLSLFIKKTNRSLSFFLGLTGGLMLQIVTFHLLPEAILLSNIWVVILGTFLGVGLICLMEWRLLNHEMPKYLKTSLLLAIGIALHNFPEGLALGSSFIVDKHLGHFLAFAILLHNLPEGIALAIPLKINKTSLWKIILLTGAAGIPTGVGAFIGAYIGTISNYLVAFCLAFAGGTMFYIIIDNIFPNAKTLHGGRVSTLGTILGFLIGVFYSYY